MQLLSAPLRVDEWGLPGAVLDEEDPVPTSVFDEDEDDALDLAHQPMTRWPRRTGRPGGG